MGGQWAAPPAEGAGSWGGRRCSGCDAIACSPTAGAGARNRRGLCVAGAGDAAVGCVCLRGWVRGVGVSGAAAVNAPGATGVRPYPEEPCSIATGVRPLRQDHQEPGPTALCAGCSCFLLSSGCDRGSYYRVANGIAAKFGGSGGAASLAPGCWWHCQVWLWVLCISTA